MSEFRSLDGQVKIRHEQKILKNAARCRNCGDVIESVHRHDFKYCSCGAIAVDGGTDYLRRLAASWDDFEDMSVYETEETNDGKAS